MKIYNKILLTAVFMMVLLCLSGCSKTNKDIAYDISHIDSYFTKYDLRLTDYKITKRQTNDSEKTDYVWLTVSGENNEFSYNASYAATYIKYNDGWRLENYSLEKFDYSALREPSLEEAKSNLSKEYTDVEVLHNEGVVRSNSKTYILSGIIKENYIIRTYEITASYEYSPETGWYKSSEKESILRNQYDIVGEWLYQDDEHIYYIHISESTGDHIKFKYSLLNKDINSNDGYWQLRQSDYETYEINHLDDITGRLNDNEHYFDVGWNKKYNYVSFADEDYIWFCNNDVTVHGIINNGFVVNGYFLECISRSSTEENYPSELRNAEEQYLIDYSTIPLRLFDSKLVNYFEFLKRTYEDLETEITQTGVNQKYSLGKVKFIDNQVYAYLWIMPKTGARPSAISLEATEYSCDELRKYFENELNWEIYENSINRFIVMIPNTDLQITVQQDVFSATVTVKNVRI